ncbi:MAG: hypothetical protein ACRCVJ_16465 [Clostridium sp.]|uniref:hypothetical protein n=1 Tax=Clostridium sp. TaxID=1506 RepID=UPI003F3A6ABE
MNKKVWKAPKLNSLGIEETKYQYGKLSQVCLVSAGSTSDVSDVSDLSDLINGSKVDNMGM